MLYQNGDGTYEPYTGGKPSPSPEYPQELVSVGDSGSVTVKVGISTEDTSPQSITIQTPNGLPSIYKNDKSHIDAGKGVIVQMYNTVVLDGNESFYVRAVGDVYTRYCTDSIAGIIARTQYYKSLCTHFPYTDNSDPNQATRECAYASHDTLNFIVEKVKFPTANDFCAWIKAQYDAGMPVTVTYILKKTIETPLSAEEIAAFKALHTNKPNTTVYNDAGAHMEMEYIVDTKTYIDNKFTELQNAILSAGANV